MQLEFHVQMVDLSIYPSIQSSIPVILCRVVKDWILSQLKLGEYWGIFEISIG